MKGAILIEMLQFKDAVSIFQKCIEINPNFGAAYYNLGYIYEQLDNHEQSINFYNKAMLLGFDLQSTLVNLALQEIKVPEFKQTMQQCRIHC